MPRTSPVATLVATSLASSISSSTASSIASRLARSTAACALAATAVAATACGTPAARQGATASAPTPSLAPGDAGRSGARVMTAEDFSRASDAPNALAAIERVRPLFLNPRPSFGAIRGEAPVISVFINGAYAGGPDALRIIGAEAVESARYLQPTEAITTLGSRYAADGVIMVQLRGFRR